MSRATAVIARFGMIAAIEGVGLGLGLGLALSLAATVSLAAANEVAAGLAEGVGVGPPPVPSRMIARPMRAPPITAASPPTMIAAGTNHGRALGRALGSGPVGS